MTVPYGAAGSSRRGRISDAAAEATRAYADEQGEAMRRRVGQELGSLNAIGALRSGRTAVAVRDAGRDFSTAVSRAGAANALQAAQADADYEMRDRDANFRDSRAAREDFASDRDFTYRGTRDARADSEFDQRFTEDRRRFDVDDRYRGNRAAEDDYRYRTDFGERTRLADRDYGYRLGRDARADMESDRGFGEDRRRYDETTMDARNRDIRDFEEDRRRTDRSFTEDTRRYDLGFGEEQYRDRRNFGEDTRRYETDTQMERDKVAAEERRYQLERADAQAEAKRKRKSSRWGLLAKVAGTAIGAIVNRGQSSAGAGAPGRPT